MTIVTTIKLVLFTALLISMFGVHAQTPGEPLCDLQQGMKLLWEQNDPGQRQAGIASIRCAAEAGRPEAQRYYATLLENGLGVRRDEREAASWLDKAVKQGDAQAMTRLAFAYLHGRGVGHDNVRGRELLIEAARLGDADAMSNLGAMYGLGDGVPQSDRLAAEWYEKGAERGSVIGQLGLANMLMRGAGVARDFSGCFVYASLAKRAGHPRAGPVLDQCASRLSGEERTQAEQRVQEWKPQAGKQ